MVILVQTLDPRHVIERNAALDKLRTKVYFTLRALRVVNDVVLHFLFGARLL
jgi:hypothetical protein